MPSVTVITIFYQDVDVCTPFDNLSSLFVSPLLPLPSNLLLCRRLYPHMEPSKAVRDLASEAPSPTRASPFPRIRRGARRAGAGAGGLNFERLANREILKTRD